MMDAQWLYPCGLPGSRDLDSASLSEADLRRLLPVCCPRDPSLEALHGTTGGCRCFRESVKPVRSAPLRFGAGLL
jgi:hypothetical protein